MRGRPRILFADDLAMCRDIARLALASLGSVETVADGEKALERAHAERPDLVIADLTMPKMDGVALCRALRRDPELRTVPVILLASSHASDDHARAVDAGADDVLAKPIQRPGLVASARRFLRPEGTIGLPRVEIDAPVAIRSGPRHAEGRVRNVSRGGAFVQAELPLVIHTELAMEFALPGTDARIAPTARVMWARASASSSGPAGAGVRFIALDGRAAQDLDDYVHEHCGQPTGIAVASGSAA